MGRVTPMLVSAPVGYSAHQHPFEQCKFRFRRRFSASDGRKDTGCATASYHDTLGTHAGEHGKQLPKSRFKQGDAFLRKAEQFWHSAALPYDRLEVPGPGVQALLDSSIRNIYQAREIKNGLPAFQVGPTCYRGLWVVDGSFLLEHLHREVSDTSNGRAAFPEHAVHPDRRAGHQARQRNSQDGSPCSSTAPRWAAATCR